MSCERRRKKNDGDDWAARAKINRHFKRILFGCLLAYEVWQSHYNFLCLKNSTFRVVSARVHQLIWAFNLAPTDRRKKISQSFQSSARQTVWCLWIKERRKKNIFWMWPWLFLHNVKRRDHRHLKCFILFAAVWGILEWCHPLPFVMFC